MLVPVDNGTAPDQIITVLDFSTVDDTDGEDEENFVVMVAGLSQVSLATVLIRDNDNGMV